VFIVSFRVMCLIADHESHGHIAATNPDAAEDSDSVNRNEGLVGCHLADNWRSRLCSWAWKN
jgi:hypothetical protein